MINAVAVLAPGRWISEAGGVSECNWALAVDSVCIGRASLSAASTQTGGDLGLGFCRLESKSRS